MMFECRKSQVQRQRRTFVPGAHASKWESHATAATAGASSDSVFDQVQLAPEENDIIDGTKDQANRGNVTCPKAARLVIDSFMFHFLVNLVIISNAIAISVEQSLRIDGRDTTTLMLFENAFIALYVFEFGLRLFARGRTCFSCCWFWFDSLLVFIAVLAEWCLPSLDKPEWADAVENPSVILIARIARLARVVRCLRFLRSLEYMWTAINTFANSMKMAVGVCVFLFLVIYVFSAIALEVITLRYKGRTDVPEDIMRLAEQWFPTIGMAMLTLLQFFCMDNIGAIYRPMIEYDWGLAFFFGFVIVVLAVIMMNTVTGVIVNAVFEHCSAEREFKLLEDSKEKERRMQELHKMFTAWDTQGTGMVELKKLKQVDGDDQVLLREVLGDQDALSVFLVLDVDGHGSLKIDEFLDGLFDFIVSDIPLGMTRIEKQIERIGKIEDMVRTLVSDVGDMKVMGFRPMPIMSGINGIGEHCQASDTDCADAGSAEPISCVAARTSAPLPDAAETEKLISATLIGQRPRMQRSSFTSTIGSAILQDVWPRFGELIENALPENRMRLELQLLHSTQMSLKELEKVWVADNFEALQASLPKPLTDTIADKWTSCHQVEDAPVGMRAPEVGIRLNAAKPMAPGPPIGGPPHSELIDDAHPPLPPSEWPHTKKAKLPAVTRPSFQSRMEIKRELMAETQARVRPVTGLSSSYGFAMAKSLPVLGRGPGFRGTVRPSISDDPWASPPMIPEPYLLELVARQSASNFPPSGSDVV